ncbi:MAG: hypothetical protein ACJ8F1_22635 [Polyangia bacterium]
MFFGALLAFGAGFSALLAETAWLPLVLGVVGADGTSIQAVLSAFFVGNAIGAWTLGRRAERRVSAGASPLREFTRLLGGAGAGILLSLLAAPLGRFLIPRISSGDAGVGHTALALAFACVVFAPATIFMGGAFAVLGRGLLARAGDRTDGRRQRLLSVLQAWNTAGAVGGALLATFGLLPFFGVRLTVVAAAAVAGAAALGAAGLDRRQPTATASPGASKPAGSHPVSPALLYAAAAAGMAAIFFEIVAIRVLTSAFDGTASAFGTVVAAQLIGGAAGAALGRVVAPRRAQIPAAFALGAVGLAAAAYGLGATGSLLDTFRGGSVGAERTAEILSALVLVAPGAALTAFLFVSVLGQAADDADSLSRIVSFSSAGAAAAPLVAALVLLPAAGTAAPLLGAVIALGLGGLVTALAPREARRAGWANAGVVVALSCVGLGIGWASKDPVRLFPWAHAPEDTRSLLQDGADGVIAIEESASGGRRLRTGSRFLDGGDASRFVERRQGWIPLLLHPAPHRVLVLGVGTGTTLGAAAEDPEVADVEAAELSGEILKTLVAFSGANASVVSRPNVHLRRADARSLVKSAAFSDQKFDVAIGDLFHPQRSGAGGLYTREHFTAVRAALAPGGIFVQWVPLHELPPPAFASLAATFLSVFPQSEAFLAYFNPHGPVLGLVGANAATNDNAGGDPLTVDGDALNARVRGAALRQALTGTLLEEPEEFFGGFVGDRAALIQWAGDAPIATDDRPSVERLAATAGELDPFATLERVLEVADDAVVPLRLSGEEGKARLAAIARYRTAVLASLRGQIAESRGNLDGARIFYQAGLAADDRFAVNRIRLQHMR